MYSTVLIKSDKQRTSREKIYCREIQYKLCELPKRQMNVGDLDGKRRYVVLCCDVLCCVVL